jgi:ABC-2 type transport system ATP-binding protein
MITPYAVETHGLEKIYRSRFRGREVKAVSNVSIRVPEGAKFGLLGANGAGKTTFVKMLLSAVHPTAGSATLFGRDARDPAARRPIGYLPENHRFPTYFTGCGMLQFYGALSGMDRAALRRAVPEMLELVGLKEWGDTRIKKYSKGMLQRLGLAQALIHRPKLLVLDEPTDGVDPAGRRHIREVLNRLSGTGVTVFINSHLLGEVESFCEYVAILKKGELALEGRINDLVTELGYRVTAVHLPSSAVRVLNGTLSPDGQTIVIQSRTREEANRAIDMVRASGGMIESVSALAGSLEDLFIRVTKSERGTERAA